LITRDTKTITGIRDERFAEHNFTAVWTKDKTGKAFGIALNTNTIDIFSKDIRGGVGAVGVSNILDNGLAIANARAINHEMKVDRCLRH